MHISNTNLIVLIPNVLPILIGIVLGSLLRHIKSITSNGKMKNMGSSSKSELTYKFISIITFFLSIILLTFFTIAILMVFNKFPLNFVYAMSLGFIVGGGIGNSLLDILLNSEISAEGVRDLITQFLYKKLNMKYIDGKTPDLIVSHDENEKHDVVVKQINTDNQGDPDNVN